MVGGGEEMGDNSNGSSTGATIGDETSQSGGGEMAAAAAAAANQPPVLEQQQPIVDPNAAVHIVAAPDGTPLQAVPPEYVDILGTDFLPCGVDAAFLAALPDDMREEVLRDHDRQMRQQARAAVPPAAPAAAAAPAATTVADAAAPAAPVDGAASAAPATAAEAAPAPATTGPLASAPGVEPLDPDFLSALPAELQAEIIEQHERAVRAALATAAAAAAPAAPPPADDGAEVIRSLPPSLRAQVLADADDTVLAVSGRIMVTVEIDPVFLVRILGMHLIF